jgi:TolB protein
MGSSEPKRITDDGLLKFAPTFIDGGQKIVYAVHNIPNRVSLMRLDLANGSKELLYPSMQVHQFDPAYSRDGRWHAYCKSSGSPQMLLIIRDERQQTEAVFTPEGARSTARTPRILPDGSRVVFTLSAPGGQQICSVDMQAKDLRRLTESTGINLWPDVSPDGKKIVFSSGRGGHLQLFTMNIDGTSVAQLADSPVRDMRPVWSPDGQRIAFSSARDGRLDVYVMNADGSGLTRITTEAEREDFPTWHPDGKHLLTVAERDGCCDLWLTEVPA